MIDNNNISIKCDDGTSVFFRKVHQKMSDFDMIVFASKSGNAESGKKLIEMLESEIARLKEWHGIHRTTRLFVKASGLFQETTDRDFWIDSFLPKVKCSNKKEIEFVLENQTATYDELADMGIDLIE